MSLLYQSITTLVLVFFSSLLAAEILIYDRFNTDFPEIGRWNQIGFVPGNPLGKSFPIERGRFSWDGSFFAYVLSNRKGIDQSYTIRNQALLFEKREKIYLSFWMSVSDDGVFPYAHEKGTFPKKRLSVKMFWLDDKEQRLKEKCVFFGFSGKVGIVGSNEPTEKGYWLDMDFFEYNQWYKMTFFFDFKEKRYRATIQDREGRYLFKKKVKDVFKTIDYVEFFQFPGWVDHGTSKEKPTLKVDDVLLADEDLDFSQGFFSDFLSIP